jgi:single-stranded DNA-specific DHH superfamily exonuclease
LPSKNTKPRKARTENKTAPPRQSDENPNNNSGIENLFDKGIAFLTDIKNSERVLLVHHTDVDGYCSGALFIRAMGVVAQEIKFELNVVAAANEELEYMIKSGKAAEYDKVVVLDIDVPYLQDALERQSGKFLIIDHHSVKADLNSPKVAYINPRFLSKEIYQPASYVVYKFLLYAASKLGSDVMQKAIQSMEWVAVLGTISDFAYDDCKDLLGSYVEGVVKQRKDITKTEYWQASKIYYGSIIVWDAGENEKVSPLLSHKDLKGFMSDPKLNEMNRLFELEREKGEKQFWQNAEKIDDVVISTISPEFKRVGSVLATDLGIKNEDKIVLVLERRGDDYKVHARGQRGKMHLGEVMNACCRSGGGHREAAGGTIRIEDYEIFKQCIIKEVGKVSAKKS